MDWPDDDEWFENKKTKKTHRKPRKPFSQPEADNAADEEDDSEYKRKRGGKRSHRPRTSDDDFWERNQK